MQLLIMQFSPASYHFIPLRYTFIFWNVNCRLSDVAQGVICWSTMVVLVLLFKVYMLAVVDHVLNKWGG
jgi:hypothetical protein